MNIIIDIKRYTISMMNIHVQFTMLFVEKVK